MHLYSRIPNKRIQLDLFRAEYIDEAAITKMFLAGKEKNFDADDGDDNNMEMRTVNIRHTVTVILFIIYHFSTILCKNAK